MKIAIDPGASGGIVIEGDSGVVGTWAMPDTAAELHALLAAYAPTTLKVAYLEDLVKYTGFNMPSSAMSVYAANWGRIEGMLYCLGYITVIVPPKKWQNVLGLKRTKGMSKPEWKNLLKAKAQMLFPNLKVTLKTADALLILAAAQSGALG